MEHSREYRTVCIFVAACLIALVASPVSAAEVMAEQETTSEGMVFDLIVLRPLGFAATVIGVSAFFLSLPFTSITHTDKDAAQKLVKEPAAYTFSRPLGHPGR